MISAQALKYLPEVREEGASKGDVRKGAMEKNWCVRVIDRKEAIGDDPIEYLLTTVTRSTFWIRKG